MIVGYKVKMRTILVTVVMLTMEKYIYSNQNGGKIGNTDSNGIHVVGLALCCWLGYFYGVLLTDITFSLNGVPIRHRVIYLQVNKLEQREMKYFVKGPKS